MPTALEAVDPQHPDLVAVIHGPLALFSVGTIPGKVSRQELRAATQVASGSADWRVKTEGADLTLRPFTAIEDEHYRLYLKAEA